MTIELPLCFFCTHYKEDATCKAFPNGIPKEIMRSEKDHTEPYPGDNGIQFEEKVEEALPER
jgi:hypothetical protein